MVTVNECMDVSWDHHVMASFWAMAACMRAGETTRAGRAACWREEGVHHTFALCSIHDF